MGELPKFVELAKRSGLDEAIEKTRKRIEATRKGIRYPAKLKDTRHDR